MALILDLRCSNCRFEVELMSLYTVVDVDGGREATCRHPGEIREAEQLTGVGWDRLVEAGRIGVRHSLTCQSCGVSAYYRRDVSPPSPDDLARAAIVARRIDEGVPLGRIYDGLPEPPRLDVAAAHRCEHCGRASLVPSDRVGRGQGHVEVPCPRCRQPLECVVKAIS